MKPLNEILEAGTPAEPPQHSELQAAASQAPEAQEPQAAQDTPPPAPVSPQSQDTAAPDELETDAPLPDDPRERIDELQRRVSGLKRMGLSERQKRQEREQELTRVRQEYEDKLAAGRAEPEAGEILDPILDPEGYARSIRDQTLNEVRVSNVRASLAAAMDENPDKFKVAYQALDTMNPSSPAARQILQRVAQSHNPGREIMRCYDELMGNPETAGEFVLAEALRDPQRRREIAQMVGGVPAPSTAPAFDARTLPSNLAGARNVGARNSAWTGPKPLGEILGEKQ